MKSITQMKDETEEKRLESAAIVVAVANGGALAACACAALIRKGRERTVGGLCEDMG